LKQQNNFEEKIERRKITENSQNAEKANELKLKNESSIYRASREPKSEQIVERFWPSQTLIVGKK
jgi:hypothetical protein